MQKTNQREIKVEKVIKRKGDKKRHSIDERIFS